MTPPTRAGVYSTLIDYQDGKTIRWYQYFDGKRFLGFSSSTVIGAWENRGSIGGHTKVVEWRQLNAAELRELPADARKEQGSGDRRVLLAT